ncbi:hypothetical protein [Lentzea sp. NPDC060358]|uniref:hypothetical protein n=1 Tax=Lentzea sp. NPDC060358 TaxID=3347103 RepID=UPI00365337BB
MKFPGDSTSWVVRSGDGGTFALFVRDALGISTPTADAIPRLVPPVPRMTIAGPPGLARDWDRWWGGDAAEPAGIPEDQWDGLRRAYGRWADFSSADSTERRDEVRREFSASVQELVADLEQELGHRPVFELEVLQVPVEGQFWRCLGRDKVLASEHLLASRNVLAPLESVIRDLAR